MIKTITLLKRRHDMAADAFHRHWRDVHAPLMMAVPGVRGYVQSRPRPGSQTHGFDGVAEVWYEDEPAMRAAFATPQYAALLEDERSFLGQTTQDSVFLILQEDRVA